MTKKIATKNYDLNDYSLYLKKNYPEHSKRTLKARSEASSSRFFYPILFFSVPLTIFASISGLSVFFKDIIAKALVQTSFPHLANPNYIETAAMIVFGFGLVVSLFFFFAGVFYGFSKARDLIFEAEKLELSTRILWNLESQQKDKIGSGYVFENKQNINLEPRRAASIQENEGPLVTDSL